MPHLLLFSRFIISWYRECLVYRLRLNINNQAVDTKFFQYCQQYKSEHSEASDKDKLNFMDFISQYVSKHPEVSHEDVVKAFQESQGKQ